MQHPSEVENCMRIDVIDSLIQDAFEYKNSSNIEELFQAEIEEEEEEDLHESLPTKPEKIIEEKSSKLELKPLPLSLKYAFLDGAENFPVIINSSLSNEEEENLIK
ncbi:hypothetical protein PIB30_114866, partial [Stylosanthes scabra]|nr:hypothetical protein [Stylosanthes scabra]